MNIIVMYINISNMYNHMFMCLIVDIIIFNIISIVNMIITI